MPSINPIILHLDMNSYFASVEQQANPRLRGKSVGVCATASVYACIIASSIEAKAKGIKTGCRARDALFLDPGVILIQSDPRKYRAVAKRILDIFAEYTDRIEPYSIDEAFLDLTGWVPSMDAATVLAQHIQQRIQDEVGEWLRCSVGIGPTRWIAKFAGDTAPKASVLILRAEDLPAYFDTCKLTDAWGINTRLERRLNRLGVYTLNDLRTFPLENLMRALGKTGYVLWANVNGIELGGVADPRAPKSIGHSHILTNRKDAHLARRVLMKLCEKTGRRLREHRLEAAGLSVWWSFTEGGGFHQSFHLNRPAFDTNDLFRPALHLFDRTTKGFTVLGIAISSFDLRPRSSQLSMFEDIASRDKLALALDAINNRYGEYTVFRGSMWNTRESARDSIGFRKTVSWEPVDIP